ncbi:MAG: ROK family protein [Candidatus Dormibacteria bacterium]
MEACSLAEGLVLAFDIGGTRVKAGVVDPAGGVVAEVSTAPAGETLAEAMTAVTRLGGDLLRRHSCSLVGICLPGIIDAEGRIIVIPGKLLGAAGTDVRAIAAETFGLPAMVAHDAIAHGAGEATHGAGAGADRVVVATIGTGVGVTVFAGGTPIGPSPFGAGGLGGHIPISERLEGRPDSNGTYDTIEALCMARRICDYARDAGCPAASPEEVFAAFAAGDPTARAGVATYRGHLLRALVALAHAHGPDVLVLGGGPMVPGNPVLPGLEEKLNQRLFGSYRVGLRMASLGDAAALVGLAALASRQLA